MTNSMSNQIIPEKVDVIIIGTGAAGLYTALQLPSHVQVALITKDSVENSDSYLAQGGISVLKNTEDYDSYFEDTLRAGRYENNKESVEIMIKASPEIIQSLVNYGIEFERTNNGFSYTREGAHSIYRILYHKDVTGKEITSKLIAQVNLHKNISVFPYTTMLDIISQDNICSGIIIETPEKEIRPLHAKVVVWATGGLGGLFEHSTNFRHITGDSFAIALDKGIQLQNLNYIQIHPTTLYSEKPGRRFLISESVRGEGAILLNIKKERFVDELLPRDLVSTAIREQMMKYHSRYVYLSIAHMPSAEIINRFPNIYQKCLEEGYDLAKDMIPVIPAQHYIMGGVMVNTNSQTSMENLFAVGEVSCNGVHGANRLASNSLLESLVFAKRAAYFIQNVIETIPYNTNSSCNFTCNNSIQKQEQNKLLIMNEIKRRDEEFYDKWCNNANQCG